MPNAENQRIYPVIRQTSEEVFVLAANAAEAEQIARSLPDTAWTDRVDRDFIVNDQFSAEDTLDVLMGNDVSYHSNRKA